MIGQGPAQGFEPGTILAERYEVVRFLGAGGMGSVVLAKDQNLQNAEVVLKFLHSSHSMNEQQFLRFQNEALLMRELNHPNIVHVYDFGTIGESLHFLSMEFVPGTTLGQLIKENPEGFSFKRSIEILYQIAIALTFAHAKGIVHRDLKPDNILIDQEGQVRLTDFGLGKSMQTDLNLTDTGHSVGTPHYMSPEQLRGEPANPLSDMYSFGLVAYELVVGKRAFTADTYLALADKHLREPIPQFVTKQNRIPSWFQDFIEKCSAKHAKKRFVSFAEVAEIISMHIPNSKRTLIMEPNVFTSSSSIQHWRVKWRFGKPKQLLLIALFLIAFITAIVIVAGGRNNQALRRIYGKYYYMAEINYNFESKRLRLFFLGDHFVDSGTSRAAIQLYVSKAHTDQLELLLGAGIDPNMLMDSGETLVQLAVNSGTARPVVLLDEFGADFSVEDDNRRNLLTLAVLSNRPELVASIIPLMPASSFNINARDKFKKTALHYAVELGNAAVVDLLLGEDAATHLIDDSETTPLMYAAQSGSLEVLDRILTKTGTAGINLRNAKGYTALHYASSVGFSEAVPLLVKYGADLSLKTNKGLNAAALAKQNGHEELLKFFD